MSIIEKAPAKINLGLSIIGKSHHTYHDLEMVMVSIDLNDYITVKEIDQGIIIDSNSTKVPLNKKNDIFKAALLIKNHFNINKGVHIFLEKNIPVCAGLGGGSSDAAATIRALNQLWNLKMSKEQMYSFGFQIGSDVPFCLESDCSYITGQGEQVERLSKKVSSWVVLVKPSFGVSTRDIFKEVDYTTIRKIDIQSLKQAILTNQYDQLLATMGNSLEDITIKKYPLIQKIKEKMLQSGADIALMTGSGPTVFALCPNESRANRVFNSMRGFCKEVYKVRML